MNHKVAKRVIIIGAGITGLTAALRLVSKGCSVTVVDSSSSVGGLAGSVMVDGTPVDRYYHFICREDNDLVKFINELGLKDKLILARSWDKLFCKR